MLPKIILFSLANGAGMSTAVVAVTVGMLTARHIGLEGAMLTVPFGLQFVSLLVVTAPSEWLMGKFGRKAIFLAAAFIGMCGGAIGGIAIANQNMLLLCLSHIMIGVNLAYIAFYRFAATDMASEAQRPIVMSLVVAGGTFAAFIGPFASRNSDPFFPGGTFEAAYYSIGVLCLISFIILASLPIPNATKPDEVKPDPQKLKEVWHNPVLWGGMLASALGYAIMGILMISSGITMDGLGIHYVPITYAIQMHVLAMFVPSLFMGKFIALFGGRVIATIGALLMASGTAAAVIDPVSLLGFQIALIFYGLGWNMLFLAGSYLVVHKIEPSVSMKVQTVNNMLIGVTTMLTSFLSGLILTQLGWLNLNILFLGVSLALFITLLWLFYAGRKVIAVNEA